MPTVAAVSGDTDPGKPCEQCNHSLGAHEMHANALPYPTDGWITCPETGCKCYSTWSVDQESREPLEQQRADYLRGRNGGASESPAT